MNKQLRAELVRNTAAKKPGRKPMPEREHEEHDATPDVLEEMTKGGKIVLDE